MIISLDVKNIALIEHLSLQLNEGLNILSGETGAGKSIIIDSLHFVLGDRADKSLIRHGETTASVQVVFSDDGNPEVVALMDEYGIERDENIIVRRVMSENGRGECRINGAIVTVSQLKKIVTLLVDIHSQNEHQSLLNEAHHIKILDNYNKPISSLKSDFLASFRAYIDAKNELETYGNPEERARKIELIEYQLEEIDNANVQENEEDELIDKRNLFQNSEKILNSLNSAVTLLSGDENLGALSALYGAKKELEGLSRYSDNYQEFADRLSSVIIDAEDVADTIKNELENSDFNPRELEKIESRIDEIRKIKRKYGKNYKEINEFYKNASAELETLRGAEARIEQLNKIIDKESTASIQKAIALNRARVDSGVRFANAVVENLRDLGMKSSTFEVEILFPDENILEHCTNNGADKVRFLISPNLGEPLKPLAKIASGGEMSRFMLGLKNITAELEGIDTLIFDEIDTGISGVIAKVVACKLYNVATKRQVIAVTHLPQLAAMADSHYLISKSEIGGKTITSLTALDDEKSLVELMRLSGSNENSAIGLENAKELKKWAISYKNAQK